MFKKARVVLSALTITFLVGGINPAFAQTPSATALLSLEPRNQYACVASYSNARCASYNPECLDAIQTVQPSPAPVPIILDITPTPLSSPETQITPSLTFTPTLTITPTPELKPVTLNPEIIFALVNEYRTKAGLSQFEKNDQVCEIANSRRSEFAQEIATGAIHAGMRARKFPFWISENMKYGGNEQEIFSWWLASPIHHSSIVGDYKYSCVACEGETCNQLFTSYVAKQ